MSNSAFCVTKDAVTASLGGFASKRERVAVAACHTALREYAGVGGCIHALNNTAELQYRRGVLRLSVKLA
jgi:hypothetical protein